MNKQMPENEIFEYISKEFNKWRYENKTIIREFGFKNFVDAFSFMTAVALEAEKADHHPNWNNTYNKVHISLSTHSAGGVTKKDLDLAVLIDKIYKNFESR